MSRPLLVIDGDSFAHRAYHALTKTIRRRGNKGAGAILGFANFLLRLYESEKPRAVLVAGRNQEGGMLRASCLCDGVKYEVRVELQGALNCHCSMCRKAQGAAFRSRAAVKAADLVWVARQALVTFYEPSSGNYRRFCRMCSSPILSRCDADPSVYGIPLGILDDDPLVRPGFHVHVASKVPWFIITDSCRSNSRAGK